MNAKLWTLTEGDGPLLATAIHNGHALRSELSDWAELSESERLREEDPFTDHWTEIADSQLIVHRSRFEMDVNRPRDKAVYCNPEDAWGLRVWRDGNLPEMLVARSLNYYDDFYTQLGQFLQHLTNRYGYFAVFDLHSYNYRRNGPEEHENSAGNPEINIGTSNMDRDRWAPLIGRFIGDLSNFDYQGRRLDVRENVKFRGGYMAQWIHQQFPESGCALAIEVKKFFMDEWSGEADMDEIEQIRIALAATITGVREELEHVCRYRAVG